MNYGNFLRLPAAGILLYLCATLTALFMAGSIAFSAEPVGYVNILNGLKPADAFTIVRNGESITPGNMYTYVQEGDAITPGADSMLIFVPEDVNCDELAIDSPMIISSCPKKEESLHELVYNTVANKFLAAPTDNAATFTTRDKRVNNRLFTLLPVALPVFIDIEDNAVAHQKLQTEIAKMPYVSLVRSKNEAAVIVKMEIDGSVQLVRSRNSSIQHFTLPADSTKLRAALLRMINLNTLAALERPGLQKGLECVVNMYTTAGTNAAQSIELNGKSWILENKITLASAQTHIATTEIKLLTFEVYNNGTQSYYIYIINYTDDGKILQVIPDGHTILTHTLDAGKSLIYPDQTLLLDSAVEHVLFLASTQKLDIAQLTQDGLSADGGDSDKSLRIRPVPEKSWGSAQVTFTMQ